MSKSVIHWFRKGLRLHDNPSLLEAIKLELELRPVFILDPWFVKNANVGKNRWRFLHQALEDLDKQLRKLGSRLFVVRGKPDDVFPELFVKWNVVKLTFEIDTEPYAKVRDKNVCKIASNHKVDVSTSISHTLYDVELILKKNANKAPLTYQKFQSIITGLGPPPKPIERIFSLPNISQLQNSELDDRKLYGLPTFSELGLTQSTLTPCIYPGGETEGLKRLEQYICEKNHKWVCSFEKPKTSPNSLKPSTTVLSPYLKFGCVSPRLFYQKLQGVIKDRKHTQPPVSLTGQLLWREFFYTCGASVENFDRIKGNPICRQIDWDEKPEFLAAWKEGRTGYPFIDAVMTQLKNEGWIHHLARHSVACFLTRGDLWISWEQGMKVFEEYLLDADWSLNAANWMWLSASAFFHQYYRVYSPIAFGKKTDPKGEYIKKYMPMLKKYPEKYIYQPWEAPLSVQKAAGCIIGKDYPRPIVDHAKISKINIGRMKAAYDGSKATAAISKAKVGESSSSKRKADSSEDDGVKKKKSPKQ